MKKNGFTLIELLITFVILGIMVSIAIPGFARWLPGYRLKSASRELYANLQLAKMGAVKDNADWAVVFDTGANRYLICSDDGDGNWTTLGDNSIEKTVNISDYEGVNYGHGNATTNATQGGGAFPGDNVSYTTPDNVTIFTPRGMVNNLGYVYLSNNQGSSYTVGTPTVAGVILMKKWTGTAWE